MKGLRIVRWIVLLIVALIIGGLSGWYYVLRHTENSNAAVDAARGLSSEAPAFTGTTGSTAQNIALSLQTEGDGGAASTGTSTEIWEVSSAPVAGADFAGSTTLSYVARSTGYVFYADPSTHANARITNTLRPKVYEALFAPSGFVVERTIRDTGEPETFVGLIASSSASSTTSSTLEGADLSGTVGALAINQKTNLILYTAIQPDGGALGMQSDSSTHAQKKLFSSPLSQWRLWWLSDGSIVLAQNAADNVPGFAYSIAKDGSFKTLASGEGLTILPRASSTAMLIGTSADGSLSLSAQIAGKSVNLPIATIADKCVWAPSASVTAYCAVPKDIPSQNFLDDWYRGLVHTEDTWWIVDATNGTVKQMYDPGANGPFDVQDPSIDATGQFISFINRIDGSLWVLRISQ